MHHLIKIYFNFQIISANFHIRNGACVHQINWMGDTSIKGMNQSFGMMINYLYMLPLIEQNNKQYLMDGTITLIDPVQSSMNWSTSGTSKFRFASIHTQEYVLHKECKI